LLKTDNLSYAPTLDPNDKYIFLLEHLEPAMTIQQLDRIIKKHNAGMNYKLIAKQEHRHPVEVLIAMLHQLTVSPRDSNKGNIKVTRPFARLI